MNQSARLHHAFEAAAARWPAKTALVSGGVRMSYGELQRRILRLAQRLRADGVLPGERVVLLLEADEHYAVAVQAVLHLGAVMVPLMPTTRPDKLAFVLQDTEACALLVDVRLAAAALAQRERCPALRVLRTTLEFDGPGEAPPGVLQDEDLAALIYTSGSTGVPKGVMLSQANMLSAWNMVQGYLGLQEADVIVLALPPTFSYGLYHLLMGLGLGATVVLERQAAFPLKLAQTLARERATVLPAVPTLLSSLLDLPQRAAHDHAALRLMSNAAAALPTAMVPRIQQAWPQARFFSMYGMTECKRISYLPPEELARRPGSVGRGLPGQHHWLVDEHGQPLPRDAAAVGELVVSGPHVMRGYWRRPEETAARLRPLAGIDGCALHTGDTVRRDDEGYLHFVARLDDIIKTRGEKVAPREVEEAIHGLPAVAACAVVGVPDALLGEAVKAYVTLRLGAALSARDVVRHCQQKLESHMVPRSVEFVAELPKTGSGKIRHAALRSG